MSVAEKTPAPPERKRPGDVKTRPHGPIVPSANVQGSALLAVIAIMSFLACLTLGGVSMVRATAASWQSQISREITIQIKPDDGLDMEKALIEARNIASSFVGVTGATIMDKQATSRPPGALARREPQYRRASRAASGHRDHRRKRTA